jgi:hypothetical protein
VTDDEDNVKFVSLNQPVLQGDLMAEQLAQEQMEPEQKRQMIMMMAQDPRSQEPALDESGKPMKKHEVSAMDIDIILDEAPDVVTVQAETFAALVEVGKAYGPEAVPFEVILEASPLRSDVKQRIKDRQSGADNPMAQKMAEMQQAMQELSMALQAANVRKAEADASKSEATAQKELAAAQESQIDATVKVAQFVTQPAAPKTQVSVS